MKELEYLVEITWNYSMDIYLCACERISVDDQYFIVIFMRKVGNFCSKVGFSCTVNRQQNKVKSA